MDTFCLEFENKPAHIFISCKVFGKHWVCVYDLDYNFLGMYEQIVTRTINGIVIEWK